MGEEAEGGGQGPGQWRGNEKRGTGYLSSSLVLSLQALLSVPMVSTIMMLVISQSLSLILTFLLNFTFYFQRPPAYKFFWIAYGHVKLNSLKIYFFCSFYSPLLMISVNQGI